MPKRLPLQGDTATTSKRFRSAIGESIEEFLCPITQAIPLEPVLAEDGKVYDRDAIDSWLKQHKRSPATNLPIGTKLVAATQVKNMIEKMVKSGALSEEQVGPWKQRIREQEEIEKLREAAERGNSEASLKLGNIHLFGKNGLPADFAKAFSFYFTAAQAGNASGMGYVASMYFHGKGVAMNHAQALRWSGAATAAGKGTGMRILSQFYRDGLCGMPIDKEQAFVLHAKACELGACNSAGLCELAVMYEVGNGTPIDMEKAAATMRKAIEHDKPTEAVQRARVWLAARGL
eukprot:CAMPEP_0119299090 /NCGR_PEP_ID=MMETSP1333-20130426/1198_1 /TAXON_ID=418940 /ORGANISM="Scyphosphaera apsteinii, Strain RCC1455" /LENGTH=289 /DNA_ID=CAMNT_0007300395 /DNA_START=46 /DNA_END=915 /DNA_ORIENTATION=+